MAAKFKPVSYTAGFRLMHFSPFSTPPSWFGSDCAPTPAVVAAFFPPRNSAAFDLLGKPGARYRPNDSRLISAEFPVVAKPENGAGTGGHLCACQPCLQSRFDQEMLLSSHGRVDRPLPLSPPPATLPTLVQLPYFGGSSHR